MNSTIDIICVGEVLIDFIGHEVVTLSKTENFHRFLGGSPTNVAYNAAILGLNVALVASCGKDGMGDFIINKMNENNIITKNVQQIEGLPTSIIMVSRSTATPEFVAYRNADYQISDEQIPDDLLQNAKIYHTTCFALSKNPAQSTIINAAIRAQKLGVKTSIDINYSNKIWPNRAEALEVINQYLTTNPLVKVSDDDCCRLFGEAKTDEYIFNYFHKKGVDTICLTKGKDGVVVSDKTEGILFEKALPITEIKDTTGAGDAFWTGFLYSKLNNKNLKDCINFGQKLAVLKLQNLGGIPSNIDWVNLQDNFIF